MADQQVEVSICIPAYKNISFMKRLLDSIAAQRYQKYEIVITDDSPDDSVQQLVNSYLFEQPVKYFKNNRALGTPENWNEAIRQADGKWIKIMHNDDWFTGPQSLQEFMDATHKYPEHKFFFAAFQNVVETTGEKFVWRCSFFDRLFLGLSPLHLFKRVYVGNPSCTLVKNDRTEYYDNRFKFVVDFEYYIRLIRLGYKYKYIDSVLLNIGFHDEQVTKYTFLVPEVQIPENLTLIRKLGLQVLRNPVVYDYFWRMFRNLGIRSEAQAKQFYDGEFPHLLLQIIRAQSRIPVKILKTGVFSKILMTVFYLASLMQKNR